jgi:hypothetical protein
MDIVASRKGGRTAGAIAATAGTAALACGVCCVLPIAVPAIALTSAGGVLAWFGSVHAWATWIAAAAVVAGWLWIWRLAAKSKAKTAPTTLWLMGIATLALGAAVLWPSIEPAIISALSRGN